MKKICIYISIFSLLTVVLVGSNAWAANIYVDSTLSQNITDGNYSIVNRNNSGSDGNAYKTVQAAVTAMSGGDDIFLRGGSYGPTELTGSATDGAVIIPHTTKDGTAEDYSSIQSYPGEWAVLDGENKADNVGDRGAVLGYADPSHTGEYPTRYWKFERLEIKNGASTDGTRTSGIWVNVGPVIVRYCYIHDNIANTGGNNPAGIIGYTLQNSIIEYNVFENNGSNVEDYEQHSVCGPNLFSDYKHDPTYWETAPYDINNAMVKNEVRYNIFRNPNKYARYGVHNKGRQYLAHKTDVTWDYKEYGDKYHHNVFLGFMTAVGCQQDFQQIYNNIIDTASVTSSQLGIHMVTITHGGNNMACTVYNNTIIGGRINANFGATLYVVNPYVYIYNNLMDQSPSDYDGAAVINLGQAYMLNPFTYEAARTDLTNNYLYRGDSSNIKATRNSGDCYGYLPISAYDSCYDETNFSKTSSEATDAIYEGTSGAGQYTTRGTHVVSGNSTISNSGKGGDHPYLSGVTIPSYLGATNPNDKDWVEGVFNLENLNNLKNGQENDPAWVEGNVVVTSDSEPSPPSGLESVTITEKPLI